MGSGACTIYAIKCAPTGVYYVGSTNNSPKRRGGHIRALRDKKHDCSGLQSLHDAHGMANLEWIELLGVWAENRPRLIERQLICFLKNMSLACNTQPRYFESHLKYNHGHEMVAACYFNLLNGKYEPLAVTVKALNDG